jgi:hypothetical protein
MKTLLKEKDVLKSKRIDWWKMNAREKFAIIQAYREVFGGPPWNEGAYCENEGWEKRVSLEEYKEKLKKRNTKCDCGGRFIPCYPYSEVNELIGEELEDKTQKPMGSIITRKKKVLGFMFSGIIERGNLIEKIARARSDKNIRKAKKFLKGLEDVLEKKGINRLIYSYEIGIVQKERKGIVPLSLLIKEIFSFGEENKIFSIIFWTSKKSPIYKIALLGGFRPVHKILDSRTGEEIIFLLNNDFRKLFNNLKKIKDPAVALIRTKKAR